MARSADDPIFDSSPAVKRQKTPTGYNAYSPEAVSSPITHTYITQPTQPLHTKISNILVPATSPEPALSSAQRSVFNRMAPPGTYLNVPPPVNSQRIPICLDSDEEDDRHNNVVSDSEDDLVALNASDIPAAKTSNTLSLSAFMYKSNNSQKQSNESIDAPKLQESPPRPIKRLGSDGEKPSGDRLIEEKVKRIKQIFIHATHLEIMSALRQHGFNENDALDALAANQSQDVIDLTQAPDEKKGVARTKAVPPPRTISIAKKYGQLGGTGVPKRRRLVKGRRFRSPTPETQSTQEPKQKIKLPQDLSENEEEEEEEAEETGSEEEAQEDSPLSSSSDDLVAFFNNCDAKQLVDLANTTLDIASLIISKRPFRSLDNIRAVQESQETAKGKRRSKKPVGQKIVDVSEQMWDGLQAVDQLVSQCKDLGKRVKDGMKKLGLQLQNNETLEIESRADSGLGTPTSQVKPLAKPSIMSASLELKSHQVVGLNWLNLLYTQGISAILADDMGLGKTCQVISFLSHIYEERGAEEMGVHLIVVPGSTLENWMREFERFSPELQVLAYHGSQVERSQLRDNASEFDVILTTYDMATNSADNSQFFRRLHPATVIFDEGHMLKNKNSNRYKMLMKISTPWRLLLTGTPLQNNLQELMSILKFIEPVMFEGIEEDLDYIFKHKAKTTDTDSEHSALLSVQRVSRAREMMAPFILRRKKEQVDSQLPPKIRRIEYCGMTERQNQIYDDQTAMHQQAIEQRKAGIPSDPRNYLMDRRKAAIHPLLFRYLYTDSDIMKMHKQIPREKGKYRGYSAIKMKEEMEWWSDFKIHQACLEYNALKSYALDENDCMDSGKVATLLKLLKQYDEAGSQTLVFSQFTSVLDILESVFGAQGIKYCRLDGSTPIAARQDLIDRFHQDKSYKVFMLSTRSGGTGINLECANKVVIFDSSFNPQDDMQAENRAHRFGQMREVEVVRLVTRGTIEEQIHALCQSKLALEGAVTGEQVEKEGMDMVQRMLEEDVQEDADAQDEADEKPDIKDAFLSGLKAAGLNVQA